MEQDQRSNSTELTEQDQGRKSTESINAQDEVTQSEEKVKSEPIILINQVAQSDGNGSGNQSNQSQQPTEVIEQDESKLKVETIAKDEERKKLSEKEVPLEANQEGIVTLESKDLAPEDPKQAFPQDFVDFSKDRMCRNEKCVALLSEKYHIFCEKCFLTKRKEIFQASFKEEKQSNQSLLEETKVWRELSKLEEKRSGLKAKMKEIERQIVDLEENKVATITKFLNAALELCCPDQWVWMRLQIPSPWILTQITSFKKESHDSLSVTFKNDFTSRDGTYGRYRHNFNHIRWVPSICGSISLSQVLISALAALNGEKAEFVPTM